MSSIGFLLCLKYPRLEVEEAGKLEIPKGSDHPQKTNKILFSIAKRSGKGQSRQSFVPKHLTHTELWTHPHQHRSSEEPTLLPILSCNREPRTPHHGGVREGQCKAVPCQVKMRFSSPWCWWRSHGELKHSPGSNKVCCPFPAIGWNQKRPTGVRPFPLPKSKRALPTVEVIWGAILRHLCLSKSKRIQWSKNSHPWPAVVKNLLPTWSQQRQSEEHGLLAPSQDAEYSPRESSCALSHW